MVPSRRTILTGLAGLSVLPLSTAVLGQQTPLTVFAAASLTQVLQDAGAAYTRRSGQQVRFSFAASSALARQVEAGAPADVFVSADEDWMDYLQVRQRVQAETRRDIVANRLVLVAPAGSPLQLRVAPGFALAAALGRDGRIATGDPSSVPVGRYAQAALAKLGVWNAVSARIVGAENVRAALNFVVRGEVPLGIVYATDARVEPRVRVVDLFPADSHAPIRYPAAALVGARPAAPDFVAFLQGPEAQALFATAGFGRP
ncbi:MAG: molybdate transporter substrate-binding protein [Pseudomonadota bacterium]|jgi:molybdate transport system substrate-binding protein